MFLIGFLLSVSYIFFLDQSLSSFLCLIFVDVSSFTDKLSQSTPLWMYLFSTISMSIIRNDQPILMELIDLVTSDNFCITDNQTQIVNFHT